MNFRWTSPTTLVAVLTSVALVVAVQFAAPLVVRVPLGLAAALVLPGLLGYRVVRQHLPNTLFDVAISLVVSVGIVAILGIGLNLLPVGLTPTSWSVALLIVSIVVGAVGDRRRTVPADSRSAKPRRATRGARLSGWPEIAGLGLGLACAALLGVSAVVAVQSQRAESGAQHLTEMWLTSDGDRTVVHVRNDEGTAVDYRMITLASGDESTTTMRLSDGEEWTIRINPPPASTAAARPSPVSVKLYRGTEQASYREVRINRPPS